MQFCRKYLNLAFFISILTIFGCAFAQEEQAPPHALTQGQILKIVMVIDKNEMKINKLAGARSQNPKIQELAGEMFSDHQTNLGQAAALGQKMDVEPKHSPKSLMLKKNGKMELSKLDALSDSDFNKIYLKSMVKGHIEALQIIDSELLPNAQNSRLIRFLKNTRSTVAHHLRMSKMVLEEIRKGKASSSNSR